MEIPLPRPGAPIVFAAIVVLDEPAGRYGGTTAAPVFAEIMQFALRQERVVPTAAATVPAQWIPIFYAVAMGEEAVAASRSGPRPER